MFQERDEALVDLRRTIVERDSLRERLKISTDNQIADKAHMEQQIEDLNGRLRILQNDKNQLEMQVYLQCVCTMFKIFLVNEIIISTLQDENIHKI